MNKQLEREEILTTLAPLYDEALSTEKWFYCSYHQMWFSPSELRKEQAAGKFIWGAQNWTLRDPIERIVELKAAIKHAEGNLADFQRRYRAELRKNA